MSKPPALAELDRMIVHERSILTRAEANVSVASQDAIAASRAELRAQERRDKATRTVEALLETRVQLLAALRIATPPPVGDEE